MLKKQTAVEYLVKEFCSIVRPFQLQKMQDELLHNAIKKAKEIEKKQITDAYTIGKYQQRMDEFLEMNDILLKNEKKD
jgi:hypothetical protein